MDEDEHSEEEIRNELKFDEPCGSSLLMENRVSIEKDNVIHIWDSSRKGIASGTNCTVKDNVESMRAFGARCGESQYAGSKVPPLLENELEFVLTNATEKLSRARTDEVIYSDYKIITNFKFRLMLYLNHVRGKKDARNSYISAFIECEPLENWPTFWGFYGVRYNVVTINQTDYRNSFFKEDVFAFFYDGRDRGWFEYASHHTLKTQGFLTSQDSLVFRVGAAPIGSESFRLQRETNYSSRESTGFVGLRNHGATCYMNALLQILYQIGRFRKAVYQMNFDEDQTFGRELIRKIQGTSVKKRSHSEKCEYDSMLDDEDDEAGMSPFDDKYASLNVTPSIYIKNAVDDEKEDLNEVDVDAKLNSLGLSEQQCRELLREEEEERKRSPSVSLALQNLFYQLYHSNDFVSCKELIRSFGWGTADVLKQQDTHELFKLLLDKVEEQMQNTSAEGCVKQMFEGSSETYIECINIQYQSSREETFEDIQLDVRGCRDIMDSLRKATATELLDGDNMYEANGYGKQPAKKGIRFKKFPPVVIFLLKRFDYDLNTMNTVKINDRFEFSKEIDLSEFSENGGVYVLQAVSVHHGDINNGHYYAFCRSSNLSLWYRFDDERVYTVDESAAIEDNFGGEDFEIRNSFTQSRKPFRNNKAYNAYILSYVRKDMAEELLMPCSPEEVNPKLNERCVNEIELREKLHWIRDHLSKYIKLQIFKPSCFVNKRFVNLPIEETKPFLTLKFDKSKIVDDVVRELRKKFNSKDPSVEYFFYFVGGKEVPYRFDESLLGGSRSHYGRLKLYDLMMHYVQVKQLKDTVDPTLYLIAVESPVNLISPNYEEFANSHIVLVNKYFDSEASESKEENCLFCLNVMHVKRDETDVVEIKEEVFNRIITLMTEGSLPWQRDWSNLSISGRLDPASLTINDLKGAVEVQTAAFEVAASGKLHDANVFSGDVVVWSLAPQNTVNIPRIGRTDPHLRETPEFALQDEVLSKPCPELPIFPVYTFSEYMERKNSVATFTMKMYDPIMQLGTYQNVNGLNFDDYKDIPKEDWKLHRPPSLLTRHYGDDVNVGLDSTPLNTTTEGAEAYAHPKEKPIIKKEFILDMRMSFQQVIKHIAWHMRLDPTHLLLYYEPPLMASVSLEPHYIDYVAETEQGYTRRVEPLSLKLWTEKKKTRGFAPHVMHFGIIPTHYKKWLDKFSSGMRSHYVIQLFNSRAECIWADCDLLIKVGVDVEGLTAKMLVNHIRQKIGDEFAYFGISKDTQLRLVNVFGENRFEEFTPNTKLSSIDWFRDLRFPNSFRYPLRIEPALSEEEMAAVNAGSLKKLAVLHQPPSETQWFFGHPFQVLVEPNATMVEIKEKIRSKLNLPERYWNQYRGWYQKLEHGRSWKSNVDTLEWISDTAVLIVEHSMPYSKARCHAAMKIA